MLIDFRYSIELQKKNQGFQLSLEQASSSGIQRLSVPKMPIHDVSRTRRRWTEFPSVASATYSRGPEAGLCPYSNTILQTVLHLVSAYDFDAILNW